MVCVFFVVVYNYANFYTHTHTYTQEKPYESIVCPNDFSLHGLRIRRSANVVDMCDTQQISLKVKVPLPVITSALLRHSPLS